MLPCTTRGSRRPFADESMGSRFFPPKRSWQSLKLGSTQHFGNYSWHTSHRDITNETHQKIQEMTFTFQIENAQASSRIEHISTYVVACDPSALTQIKNCFQVFVSKLDTFMWTPRGNTPAFNTQILLKDNVPPGSCAVLLFDDVSMRKFPFML